MNPSQRICLGLTLLSLGVGSGCASIVSGRNNDVAIKSYPPQANVVIQNENGETVATAMTPAKVSLKRGNGILRKPPRYVATIAKPGFQPTRVPINPKMNPWVAGNLLIGGPLGLAADSATGAIWRHSPADIKTKLTPYDGAQYSMSQPQNVVQAAYVSD
ncbi:hypothetical protein [Bythopirellula goksoeyrii]|uniref:PEGA domain-containing protein n=1 Tax=Bythopirellula goksoeyrii TaxID=1400387 RepID=A0A5B9QH38_9BACT|nr:hypothetical protein [Bythopirellula goksoeyrii]QEG36880.1 hypothetical protein Pr1d_42170 [Bythopirellula goksoeyrii]